MQTAKTQISATRSAIFLFAWRDDNNKNTNISLYCRSGNRSGKAVKILQQQGYTNVVNAGGLDQARLLLERNIVSN